MYRTDMAVELLSGKKTGCVVSVSSLRGGLKRTDVEIATDNASARLGKPKGFYTTIETSGVFHKDVKAQKAAAAAVSDALSGCLKASVSKKTFSVMAAGLGNRSMTADALGPLVCNKLIVTRHTGGVQEDGALQSLCALSPGVLGTTGIETFDIIAGAASKVRPDVIITVDSLASRAVSRLASAFQITDTGIAPGSGVNNHRFRLDKKTLGIPVIAIGVPLVVYASTIAGDVIDEVTSSLMRKENAPTPDYAADKNNENMKAAVINKVVNDLLGDLIVTPKDIDMICEDCAHILALAINSAVHGISIDRAAEMMS